ncbi:HemK2/MTQ2 family protein methyltransferase [Thermococcus thioreducens]|uniref:Protoporphyrinogen oxidase n=1 Tax=Thermococcus thioreducens TaxID=277988 RepID=A0A0Q2M3H4_9EURY|nr:HemK2/MTQ2 family protein methyltransferase [Thermococcus thioreducens]ASJ11645.1 protoporphyrinogen oxidase [Thermococcus thioreducens]KQH82617.1 protoporphyrinogen oxidase [Thermococcus thioreducens]SEW16333.1 release factor glutamine methyltransferase [Thermococcus thioreducens]
MPTYYGIKLKLHPDVYEPAEDTFLLAENLAVREGDRALDVGTGTGLIALLMARKARFVLGVDINPLAVELARENARLNGIQNIEFRLSDLFENVSGKFDVITFNAPYLPGEPEEPIDLALVGGKSGREVLDRFIREVPEYLKPCGVVQIVQSSITGVDETIKQLEKAGLRGKIAARMHVFFEDIVLINATLSDCV